MTECVHDGGRLPRAPRVVRKESFGYCEWPVAAGWGMVLGGGAKALKQAAWAHCTISVNGLYLGKPSARWGNSKLEHSGRH